MYLVIRNLFHVQVRGVVNSHACVAIIVTVKCWPSSKIGYELVMVFLTPLQATKEYHISCDFAISDFTLFLNAFMVQHQNILLYYVGKKFSACPFPSTKDLKHFIVLRNLWKRLSGACCSLNSEIHLKWSHLLFKYHLHFCFHCVVMYYVWFCRIICISLTVCMSCVCVCAGGGVYNDCKMP